MSATASDHRCHDLRGRDGGGATRSARLPKTGDADEFEAAVRPHYAPLIRRLVLVLGDPHDAEDVAQDAYLSAFRSWDRFDGTDVRAWLLHSSACDWRSTTGGGGAAGSPRSAGSSLGPGRDPSDPDLWAALATLDQSTRSALLLNVLDGYTQAEIARMLSVPEGTVASWISRGRAALRRELDPDC